MSGVDASQSAYAWLVFIAPVGIYLLAIGVVNSHARPWRISRRTDTLALTGILLPLSYGPIESLLPVSYRPAAFVLLALAAMAVVWTLTRRERGWVVYNVDPAQWRQALENAIDRSGIRGQWDGQIWKASVSALQIRYAGFAMLRNVSVSLEAESDSDRAAARNLAAAVDREFTTAAHHPSTAGAVLFFAGMAVVALPAMMLEHSSGAITAMVARLFS